MGPGEHDLRELQRLLKELGERLDAVEQRLGIRREFQPPTPPPVQTAAPRVELTQTFPAAIQPLNTPIPQAPAEIPQSIAPLIVHREPLVTPPTERPNPATQVLTPRVPVEPWSLERLVGGRYFLAAGAIVVVIGVGLFLKLGYDMGWFRMSNAWKCIWGAAFGMAMVGAGEVVRRRINVLASTGLSAAGVGALYLSTYAAHGFYSLIGPVIAFVLLGLVVALGITIAVVARQAGVAVLAILGGYLAPFLLDINHPTPSVVPLHTFALLVTGLSLSGWLPSVFRVLCTIAWWGTLILSFVWFVQQGVNHPFIALPFFALVWGVVHAELILSVRGEYESDAPTDDSAITLLLRWRNVRPIATSISTSVWTVFFGIIVLRNKPILPDWFVPAAATAAAALLSMLLAGHLRVLKDSPRTDAQRLGAGLAMQAGAALIAAVALALSGSLEVCAWLAIGAAAVAAGAWIGAPSLGAYGLVPLSIGAFRLVTWDAFQTRTAFTPLSLGTLVVDRWTLLMMFGAAAWIGAGLLLARLRERARSALPEIRTVSAGFLRVTPDACMIVGLVLLLGSFLHPDTSRGAVSVAWMLAGVFVGVSRLREQRFNMATYSIAVLIAAGAAWAFAYIAPDWTETAHGAIVHAGALVGGALTLAWAGLAVWYRHDRSARPDVAGPHWIVCAAWAISLTWCVTSLEVFRLAGRIESGTRASAGGLSIWWGMFAVGLFLTGYKLKLQALRLAGFAGIILALGAWTTAFIVPGWTASAHDSIVHPGFVIAAALVATMAAFPRLWRAELTDESDEFRVELVAMIIGAVTLAWLSTSLEAFRLAHHFQSGKYAQHAAVSVWWGLFSIALLAAGFRYRVAPLRYAGLALLGVATIKALIIDLSEVSAGWRVVSVLGLGLLMLGVALVYVKTSAKLLGASPRPPSGRGNAPAPVGGAEAP